MAHEVLLPVEIITQIVGSIPCDASNQPALWACSLVSRTWYQASIGLLYLRPYLNGGNFDLFVKTICPSKNAHIRASPLSSLVQILDMGELGHNSSRSLMARLIGRLKGNLREFLAPQVSFSVNSFAALSKCKKLRYLDLSLVSASISTRRLFQAIQSLPELESLYFPRCSSNDQEITTESYVWPPRLRSLYIAGGVDDQFLISQLSGVPRSLSRLSIRHCPQVTVSTIVFILSKLGKQLRRLTICHPMPQISRGKLDNILNFCPSLHTLRVSADYISDELFKRIPENHPLQNLILECSPNAEADVKVSPEIIYNAARDNFLPNLRRVIVSQRLAWMTEMQTREDTEFLSMLLHANENENPLGVPCGVSLIDVSNQQYVR
ncbi:hypothetical protein K3495_g721 [Podosphaera aphanis]|nr:hypothetical protein K3495_g721 [Podosphaera aphanis]